MAHEVVVIGAGLSGLTAARQLREQGLEVLLLDKGHKPGGRMATKSFEGARFDYGAQFFTVRSEAFGAMVEEWVAAGLAAPWSYGFHGREDGHPRYIGVAGVNSIAAHLAKGLEIRCGAKVSLIHRSGENWVIDTDFEESIEARSLIVTCPVPQSLKLLEEVIPDEQRAALEQVEYDRCLALMALLEEPIELPSPGAYQDPDGEPLSWIADNTRKGITSVENAVTFHAGPKYSEENWESPAEDVALELLAGRKASAWKLHRWKYSKPRVLYPEASCLIESGLPLVLAGDAFGEPRVEGAVLSGLTAAAQLRERLLQPL